MYLEYWKMVQRPFDERIDCRWFFPSGVHRGTALQMQAMIDEHQTLAMLVGATGTGKSTVAATLADQSSDTRLFVVIPVCPSTASGVVCELLNELHHAERLPSEGSDRPRLDEIAQRFATQLARRQQAGQHVVAIIDAADELPDGELSGLLPLLERSSNGSSGALTSFLVGSTELLVRARRLVSSGVSVPPQLVLGPMVQPETVSYVRHRVQRAGGDPEIFSRGAIELIHELSSGVPRRINRLCDLCLLVGFHKNANPITEWVVWTAQAEVRTLSATRTALAAPTRRWRPLGPGLASSLQ